MVPQHIAAVVVTRNRPEPLSGTVASLMNQTRPPDVVLVVDSGSTTELPELPPGVELLLLSDNVGFGAALAAGMESLRTRDQSPDLFWLLDDDSPVDAGSLEAAIEVLADHTEVGLLANRGTTLRLGVPQHLPAPTSLSPVIVGSALIDGALVRSEVVERCGTPRTDLFMMHEDLEYTTRIAQEGFGIAMSSAVVSRPAHLGSSEAGANAWRLYYQSRNHIRIALDRRSPVWLVGSVAREVKIAATALAGGRRSSARAVVLGATDAVRGRMGRTHEPGSL